MVTKKILQLFLWKHKYELMAQIRAHNKISDASELLAFEIFKLLVKINKKSTAK